MSVDQAAVRRALIGLIDGDVSHACNLSEADWNGLATIARNHRIEPLLHHQARRLEAVVPAAVAAAWAAAFRRAAIRSLLIQRTLVQASQCLTAQSIRHIALKGAWLAWHGYAHPALRPMRDIDLLIDPARLMDAYDALSRAGFAAPVVGVPVEYALTHHKHLPPLRSIETGIAIELHSRLVEELPKAGSASLFDDPARLLSHARAVPYGEYCIPCADPTDSLLHLIIHSVVDHRFNNGPLILTDIEAAARSPVNWTEFWHMARAGGWERACELVLALASRYRRSVPPLPCVPPVPQPVLEATASLLFAPAGNDDRTAMDLALAGMSAADGDAGPLRKLRALIARSRPTRHALAIFAGVPTEQPGVWRHYPAWALSRLSSLWSTRQSELRADLVRHHVVNTWINAA